MESKKFEIDEENCMIIHEDKHHSRKEIQDMYGNSVIIALLRADSMNQTEIEMEVEKVKEKKPLKYT